MLETISPSQFLRMIDAGVLGEDEDRAELLEGVICLRDRQTPPHATTLHRSAEALRKWLPPSWHVRVRATVTTSESVVDTDLAVIRGPFTRYDDRHPTPADTALIVEVADSSLARDRGLKLRIYARAAIPAYWIVNLIDHVVEVHTVPTGPAPTPTYGETRVVKLEESLSMTIAGHAITIPASELFSG